MKYLHTPHRTLRHIPVIPFIYLAGLFIVLLDIFTEIYHRISFPLYGVRYISRKQYIRIDRHRLKYLNPVQKFNCVYCGYANGVLQNIVRIVAETEIYWCGIKHEPSETFIPPTHHSGFIEYGNKEQYDKEYRSKKTRML